MEPMNWTERSLRYVTHSLLCQRTLTFPNAHVIQQSHMQLTIDGLILLSYYVRVNIFCFTSLLDAN